MATHHHIPPAFARTRRARGGRAGARRGCNKDELCPARTSISAISSRLLASFGPGAEGETSTGPSQRFADELRLFVGRGGGQPLSRTAFCGCSHWSSERRDRTEGPRLPLASTKHTSPLAPSPVNLAALLTVTARCQIYCRRGLNSPPPPPPPGRVNI